MNKDFRLILQLAGDVHAVMPATSASFQINSDARDAHDEDDVSAVMKFMEQLSVEKLSVHSMTG